MILFYRKSTGDVFATIAGRVHDAKQIGMTISDSTIPADDIGTMIIGWEETNETEEYDVKVEELQEQKNGLFKKVKKVVKEKRRKLLEHNTDKFSILQEIESISPTKGLDYRVDKNGQLTKKPVEKTKPKRTRVATDVGMTGEINLRRDAIRLQMKDLRKNKPIKLDKNI